MDERAETVSRWLEEYRRLIYKVVMVYAADAHAQEDLFQEIAIALWRSSEKFNGLSQESTWIYRVALNTAIDVARREQRAPRTIELHEDAHWVALDEPDEEQAWLYARMRQLGLIDRSVLLLYLDGNRYEDIAEVLGISKGNVGAKISRVKERLKTFLENEEEDAS